MGVTRKQIEKSEEMAMQQKWNLNQIGLPALGMLLLGVTGCHQVVDDVPPPKAYHFTTPPPIAIGNPAGLPVDPAKQSDIVAVFNPQQKTVTRPDVWALSPLEQDFDTRARNEKIFATTGGTWPTLFQEKPEAVQVDTIEPQPFRRLAGVLVGDSVMAIIDMGDGSPMQVIRPGMQIPNSPWKVISIDEEKAVLRRSGNKRPKEIVVRLQGPAAGGAGNFTAPTGNQGGNPANPNPGQGGNRPPRRGGGGGGKSGVGGGAGGID